MASSRHPPESIAVRQSVELKHYAPPPQDRGKREKDEVEEPQDHWSRSNDPFPFPPLSSRKVKSNTDDYTFDNHSDIDPLEISPRRFSGTAGELFTGESCDERHDKMSPTMTISSSSRLAGQTVAPFLAKHFPEQYTPPSQETVLQCSRRDPSSRYCYRHRPDLKCRESADEKEMDVLQKNLESLSQSDQQGIAHMWSLFSAAPPKTRTLMLQGILTQCCFPQLSYISTAVSDLIRIDFISALPAEVSFKILCYLDTISLCKAAQVSQRWRTMADDDVVWHKMCEQHIDRKCTKCGWGLPVLDRKRLREWKRQQQLRASKRGVNQWSPKLTPVPESSADSYAEFLRRSSVSSTGKRSAASVESTNSAILADEGAPSSKRQCMTGVDGGIGGNNDNNNNNNNNNINREDNSDGVRELHEVTTSKPKFRPWKEVYKDRFKVGTNWKYGRYTTKVFRGHSNGIMCMQFDGNVLATGSYDSTIKIWDMDTGTELRTLRGHTSGIRALQFDDTKLISGSLDRTLRVWNWRTGECISTYQGHTEGVITLHFESNLLASGSVDRTVKIWNFYDKSTFTLRGHADWVNAVRIDLASRTVFSASDDCTVKLWDLDTKACIKTFEGHVGQVQQVVLLPPEYEPDGIDLAADPDAAAASDAETAFAGDNNSNNNDSVSSAGSASDEHHHHGGSNGNGNGNSSSHNKNSSNTRAESARASFGDGFAPDRCSASASAPPSSLSSSSACTLPPARARRALPPRFMLTCALDSTVRLWDVATRQCLRTFFGHVEGVWALAADTLRIVSGAEDRMVKVWDARSGRCERTFTGHRGPVTCLWLSDSRMCTGSEDGEARLWSFKPQWGGGGSGGGVAAAPAPADDAVGEWMG